MHYYVQPVMGRVDGLIEGICQGLQDYSYNDVMRALEERRKERPRGRYEASWPTEREVIWLIAHSSWSVKTGEDRYGRAQYTYSG